jgi:hypothetical protein
MDDEARNIHARYSIYAFELTSDPTEEGRFNLSREGSVRVDVMFSNALQATINVVAYVEFENVIEID